MDSAGTVAACSGVADAVLGAQGAALIEEIDYSILFRWFVGLNLDVGVWDATVFTKNRDPNGGDTNLYAYVGDIPLNWVDSFGTNKKEPKVCNDFVLKRQSLEYTFKIGPEIEVGVLDVGGSIFKNFTTGETGGRNHDRGKY